MGSMELLWAPWRSRYIASLSETGEKAGCHPEHPGCPFCEAPLLEDGPGNLVLHRGRTCFVIMNLYPYNGGHVMVVPFRHLQDPQALLPDERGEMFDLCIGVQGVLRQLLSPHGFNVGMNVGRAAGAGIDQHIHLHVVPRWEGDANFMLTVGGAKVQSEGLIDFWHRARPVFAERLGA